MSAIRLIHVESGRVLADQVEVARTTVERMRGLIGRTGIEHGGGMMIQRCSSIHTFFMRFPIDVIFLDGSMRVKKVVRNLMPWRFAASPGAAHTVELPAGTLDRVPLSVGDSVMIEECP